MNVLFIAAEAVPFAKTGGLGDVVGSLPEALRELGIDARVLMPHYGTIDSNAWGLTYEFFFQEARNVGTADVHISKTINRTVPYYFLRSWPFFDEPYLYTDENWDIQRFVFFAQAAMTTVWQLGQGADRDSGPWWPDIIHVHDWHTGLIPYLLHLARFETHWNRIASILSIHNMGYKGMMAGNRIAEVDIQQPEHPVLQAMGMTGDLLPIGLAYADKLNTVSPNHATELHYPRFGEGLETIIWARDADFSGIINGLDMNRYDPETDKDIFQNFNAENYREARIENKRALQKLMGLEVNDDIPVIGVVSRLVDQKGIDLLAPALRVICAEQDVQVAMLGTGQRELEHQLWLVGNEFPQKARANIYYDAILAQRIYAGSDFIVIPSRYEPCGMAQMIALRYGALPIARETGGLVDTIDNYDNGDAEFGTGFLFLWEEVDALINTLRWALDTYRQNRPAIERMQERGMRHDWSWTHSARRYETLYKSALSKKRSWMSSDDY